jgi:hypothetical protein
MTPGRLDQPLGSRNSTADPIPRLYPEVRAGGFTRYDQHVIFFARVNALLRTDMTGFGFRGWPRHLGRDRERLQVAAHHSARGNVRKSLASTSIQLFWRTLSSIRLSFCRLMDRSLYPTGAWT